MPAHHLTVVGLGPGDTSLRTIAAQNALDKATCVVLRTGIHPGVDDLVSRTCVTTCDDLYDESPTYRALYPAIVDRILGLLEVQDVVYAVPGNPVAGELTVIQLRSAAVAAGHTVEVIPGTGGLDVIAATTGLDLMSDGVQTVDALELRAWIEAAPFNGSLLDISPVRPVVITQVHKHSVATAVMQALLTAYPAHHEISVIGWDSTAGVTESSLIPLDHLDQVRVDHLTSVVVPPIDWKQNTRQPHELFRIAARLRDVDGCPWDREQTHESIRAKVIEEAYEVADAIDAGVPADLAEELGDLLIQAALHAQIANEAGTFDIADVFDAVSSKLIRRHPHVFGDVVANDPEAVIRTWDAIKATEPGKEDRPKKDPYTKLPDSMPVAAKIQLVEQPDGSTLSPEAVEDYTRRIVEMTVQMVRAGIDPNPALDTAYRIIRG